MTTADASGVDRIGSTFDSLRVRGGKALCPFLCAGFPQPGTLARTLPALEEAGASMVEVGVPFSDPIADGPVIASAMHDALEQGVTPDAVLDEVQRARLVGLSIPVVLMGSVSLIEHAGAGEFAARCAASGVDGVILPDSPVEEAERFATPFTDLGLGVSLLVSPTTPADRAARIADACAGFVYVLTRTGITGTGNDPGDALAPLRERVTTLREVTDLPLACGFGIATADDVRRVVHGADADGAIVGTALVRCMGEAVRNGQDPSDAAAQLTRELAAGCAAG